MKKGLVSFEMKPSDIVLVIAGNMIDRESARVVSKDMAEEFVRSLSEEFKDVVFGECSAKTGEGVEELFQNFARSLVVRRMQIINNNGEDV